MRFGKLQRYIAYNIALLVLITLCALLALTLMRQYGTTLTRRHDADTLLQQAHTSFQQNALFECQRTLERALATDASIAEDVINTFADNLLSLPNIQLRLHELLLQHKITLSKTAHGQLALYSAQPQEAQKNFQKGAENGEITALHWLGQLHLEKGELLKAQDCFTRYWSHYPELRQKLYEDILSPAPKNAIEHQRNGQRLFQIGLWREAFKAFDNARKKGAQNADLDFFAALELELNQHPEKAIPRYRAILQKLPTHYRSLQRLIAHHQSLTPTT